MPKTLAILMKTEINKFTSHHVVLYAIYFKHSMQSLTFETGDENILFSNNRRRLIDLICVKYCKRYHVTLLKKFLMKFYKSNNMKRAENIYLKICVLC